MSEESRQSRRAVLAGGLSALVGGIAASLSHPLPALATQKAMSTGVDNAADAETRLYRTNDGVVFSLFSPTMPALQGSTEVLAIGTNVAGASGIRTVATGAGATAIEAQAFGTGATGIRGSGATSGVEGTSQTWGISGVGIGVDSVGVRGYVTDANAKAIWGFATQGATALLGMATGGGTAAQLTSDTGIALDVSGRARFNRSGRGSIVANHTYVDVTVAGGLASTAFIVATLQTYRSGVYVAAVRPNYPSTGKARIYLNKVASTTSSTVVGWIAIG